MVWVYSAGWISWGAAPFSLDSDFLCVLTVSELLRGFGSVCALCMLMASMVRCSNVHNAVCASGGFFLLGETHPASSACCFSLPSLQPPRMDPHIEAPKPFPSYMGCVSQDSCWVWRRWHFDPCHKNWHWSVVVILTWENPLFFQWAAFSLHIGQNKKELKLLSSQFS